MNSVVSSSSGATNVSGTYRPPNLPQWPGSSGSLLVIINTVSFPPRRTLDAATTVDRVGCHRRDRSTNILRVQTTGENQESRVAHRSPRSGPIARLTRAAAEFGVVRIDKYIAFWKRSCLFWLES